MKIFKPRKFKVSFASRDAMKEFELYMHDCEGFRLIQAGITEQIGPKDDGSVECIYTIKWNKVEDFKLMIGRYNLYAEVFSSKFCINGWEKL